ncbi:MAG: ACP S-malonyltransferase [Candidatus Dormibacteria bacterium]
MSARVGLCFPGQGSQAAGMATGLLHERVAVELLQAAAASRLDLAGALEGDDDALRPTDIAQPALLLVEVVLARALGDADVVAVAGHSVGEYAACTVAGALSPGAAMQLVIERGRAMAAMRHGTMAAVLGLQASSVAELCENASRSTGESVVVANLNAPEQTVISGTTAAVQTASTLARQQGARRVISLNVSGAFHSPLMADASARFADGLDEAHIDTARVPVVCNVDAQPVTDAASLRAHLREQLTAPVRWIDCVHRMLELGVDMLLEVGPGAVLTGLARRIAPDIRAVSVNTIAAAHDMAATVAAR